MSRSHHVIRKDLNEFPKKEIDEMVKEPESLFHQLADERKRKNDVKEKRKNQFKKI